MKLLAFLFAAAVLAIPQLAPLIHNQDAEVIPGEYIVIYKDSLLADPTDSIIAQLGLPESSVLYRYEQGFAASMSQESVQVLRTRPEIDFIEPNQVVYAQGTQPNPPSWGLSRISQRKLTESVYKFPDTAGDGIYIYVIDTGINVAHSDFQGRAYWGFVAPGMDGKVDGNGHGTHVASTCIGKQYGVAKKSYAVAVKVLSSSGSGSTAGVIAGVEWAARDAKGWRCSANMSLGGGRSTALDRAVENAVKSGLHFAVAAGNSNIDACNQSPAAVEIAVTVGSTTETDSRSSFSNIGKCVDIFAPGSLITGAWIGSTTAKKTISGTSMASPHVAGVMALFLSEADYSPAELKAKLIEVGTMDVITNVGTGSPNVLLYNV